jgi:hypothetical protein
MKARQSAMLSDLIIQAVPTGTQDGSDLALVLTSEKKPLYFSEPENDNCTTTKTTLPEAQPSMQPF